jgi:excisionase family DNA binding protein
MKDKYQFYETKRMKMFDLNEQEKIRYLSIDEASRLLQISKSKLYKMVAIREIPHFKVGRRVLFKADELHQYISTFRVEVVTVPN